MVIMVQFNIVSDETFVLDYTNVQYILFTLLRGYLVYWIILVKILC
jgi:hypothetical protein